MFSTLEIYSDSR